MAMVASVVAAVPVGSLGRVRRAMGIAMVLAATGAPAVLVETEAAVLVAAVGQPLESGD